MLALGLVSDSWLCHLLRKSLSAAPWPKRGYNRSSFVGFVLKVPWGHLPHTPSSWQFDPELPFSTDSHFCCNTKDQQAT